MADETIMYEGRGAQDKPETLSGEGGAKLPVFPMQQVYFNTEVAGEIERGGMRVVIELQVQGFWCQAMRFGVVLFATGLSTSIDHPISEKEKQRWSSRVVNTIFPSILEGRLSNGRSYIESDHVGHFIDELYVQKNVWRRDLDQFVYRMSEDVLENLFKADRGEGEGGEGESGDVAA